MRFLDTHNTHSVPQGVRALGTVAVAFILVLLASCTSSLENIPSTAVDESLDAILEVAAAASENELVIVDGDEVTIEAYQGHPDEGGTLLASSTVTASRGVIRSAAKDLVEANPDTDHLVISANGQSRVIDLSERHRGEGKPDDKKERPILAILEGLADGTVVGLALYQGDPSEGGSEVASSSYTVGESSFRESLKALFESAGDSEASHLLVSVGDASETLELPSKDKSDNPLKELYDSLEDGTEIGLALYQGHPDEGGSEVASSTITKGTGDLRKALHDLRKGAGRGSHDHIVVSAAGQSVIIDLSEHKGGQHRRPRG